MAIAALLTVGIASPTDTGARHVRMGKKPSTVVAMRSAPRSSVALLRLDRRTLAPVGKRRVALGQSPGAWAVSPDGKRLAVGVEEALGLRIVDLTRMRRIADITTRNGLILGAAWLTPRRIVGVEETGVFVVDPVKRRLLRSEPLDGFPVGVSRAGNSLVLLLSPVDQIGFARLAAVDADGTVRSVVLDRILAGSRFDETELTGESWRPGLAVDAVGGRAFVVGGGAPVAEIDLASMAVRYHDLTRPASLLGRLRNWFEPAAHAKGPVAGSWRTARWLGGDRLVFTGEDGSAVGGGRVETTAAGLTLVDTTRWSARTLEARANGFGFAAGTIVATRQGFEVGRGIGLVGFDRDGTRRFHLLGDERLSVLEALDERVFLDDERRMRAADVRRARLVPAPRTLPRLLVGNMQGY
jgi:hypothetical protein